MDWLDLLAVQGTLTSLLKHHSSKASVLRCSAFLIVQLSHPYMTTGKTIALTRQTSVGKVISLHFNMLPRLVITFLPKSKCLFNSMAAVTICSGFGAQDNKVCHCFHCFPTYLPWSMATHFSILAWRIPWTEKPGRLQAMGSQRDRHDWVTSLSLLRHNTMSIYLFRTLPMGGMSRSCKVRVELIHWLWSQQAIKTHIKML